MKEEGIEKYLQDNGIKPSYIRVKVYEYLIQHKNHPTVDYIYRELVDEIHTLSKTTIYNTLKLFLEKNIVQLISIEENEARYDADISTHAHFKCKDCGHIYDFTVNAENIEGKGIEKFQVDERHIYFKGICEKCLKK